MRLPRLVLVALLGWLSLAVQAEIDEGIEYRRIAPPVAVSTAPGQIEVVEMFWYGCPHCFRFEPLLEEWVARLPKDVMFRRVPAVFNPTWALHAKAYYTAELLKVLDKMHPVLFDALHVKRQKLKTVESLRKLFAANGVAPADFDKVFNSFAVDVKLRRAADLTRRYGIDGVPSLIIQGKYLTDGPMAGGHRGMLRIADYLIARERKARQGGK